MRRDEGDFNGTKYSIVLYIKAHQVKTCGAYIHRYIKESPRRARAFCRHIMCWESILRWRPSTMEALSTTTLREPVVGAVTSSFRARSLSQCAAPAATPPPPPPTPRGYSRAHHATISSSSRAFNESSRLFTYVHSISSQWVTSSL